MEIIPIILHRKLKSSVCLKSKLALHYLLVDDLNINLPASSPVSTIGMKSNLNVTVGWESLNKILDN